MLAGPWPRCARCAAIPARAGSRVHPRFFGGEAGPAQRIPGELLAHVSPLGWEHINLTGEYCWPGADRRAPRNAWRRISPPPANDPWDDEDQQHSREETPEERSKHGKPRAPGKSSGWKEASGVHLVVCPRNNLAIARMWPNGSSNGDSGPNRRNAPEINRQLVQETHH